MLELLCIGHAAWDRIVTVPRWPAEDTKVEATGLSESGGGPAANAAYLLSRWGVRTAFAGVVGADEAGRRTAAEFQEAGTDTRGLELRPGHATPTSLVLVSDKSGSRTIITRKAPTGPLTLDAFPGEAPKVLLFDGHELEAALAALERFPSAVSILDAGSLREGTKELAGRVDHLVASERFAAQVLGRGGLGMREEQEEALEELCRINPKTVVITLGIRGQVYGTAEGRWRLSAFSATVVDTTAAGDIFHGAYAYGVLHQLPPLETLELASMAAALSVERPGGRASIPSLEEVREALADAE
jgi:sugar/nucleoside kinase (ribokinase family)